MTANVFDPYVPSLVRDWVGGPDPAGPHRRLSGTLVFADVSGFTKMSERLSRRGKVGAETIAGVIETCFTQLLEVSYSLGGTLLQFSGDAVLLFYRGPGHELRAAASALEMRRTMRSLGDVTQHLAGVRLSMTVGVHSGGCDFFLVGRSHRQLVVGGAVASQLVRLEGMAERGQILAGDATAAALPRRNLGAHHELGRRLVGRIDTRFEHVESPRPSVDMAAFVAAGLRDTIADGRVESEHRTATVAFVGYRGLDDVIDEHGAAEAARRLDALVAGTQAAIDARGICFQSNNLAVDGGNFYLSAGAPHSTGQDEEQMLLALTEIVALDVGLPLRAGVNSGSVFTGEIRSRLRSTFITMGDPVNLAARVMSKATPSSVYTTRPVLDRSRTLFDTVAVAPFMVKGKAKPVEAFAVGAPRGARAEIAASDLPLVGREHEMRRFLAARDAAATGSGAYLQVVADAGVGKSRLLDEFEASSAPVPFRRVRCRLYQASTPYFSFSELLPTLLGLGPAEARSGVLRRLVTDRAPDLLPWLALIGTACGLDIEPSAAVDALEPEYRKAQLESAVVALLSRVVAEPVILCFEDAQWMDDASCDLFDALVREIAGRSWLVVLAQRPEVAGATEQIRPPDERLELHPLGAESLAELVSAVTASDPLPRHLVDALVVRSDGNPLFLLELVNAAQAGGDVDSLPTSVEGLLTARIDRLSAVERALLRRISVLGAAFDMRFIDTVTSDATPRWRETLARLDEFVRLDDEGWVWFRHHLVRDVAYQSLPYRLRRELHERVAESILSRSGDELDDVAPLLSLHFFYANRPEEAWRFSTLAGDRAKAIFANLDAVDFYRRALLAANQIDLDSHMRAQALMSLGDVEDMAGMYVEARRSYAMARRLVRNDRITEARLHLKTAFVDERLGNFTTAVRSIRRGLRALETVDGDAAAAARAELLGWYAAIRVHQGKFGEAVVASEDAVRLASHLGPTATTARALMTLDFARSNLGEDVDLAGSRQALEIYTGLGDIAGEATAANVLGAHAYFAGQWDEAVALYRRSRLARERTGDPVGVAYANANLAEILVEQGELDEADALLATASSVWRASNDSWGAAFAGRLRGLARARAGDFETADDLLRQARSDFAAAGATPDVVETDVAMAELLLLSGLARDAVDTLDAVAAADPARAGLEHLLPAIYRLRGTARAALDPAEGGDDLDRALHLARERGAEHEIALALRARHLVRGWRGQSADEASAVECARLESRLGLGPRLEPRPAGVISGSGPPGRR